MCKYLWKYVSVANVYIYFVLGSPHLDTSWRGKYSLNHRQQAPPSLPLTRPRVRNEL